MSYYAYITATQTPDGEVSQREAISGWCSERGVTLSGEVREDMGDVRAYRSRQISTLLEAVPDGATLVAADISCLGRSLVMIWDVLGCAFERGITVCPVEQDVTLSGPDDPLCDALRIAVDIQRRITTVRTRDALTAAKARGRKTGRPAGVRVPARQLKLNSQRSRIKKMLAEGCSKSEIAQRLHCDRHTLASYITKAGL